MSDTTGTAPTREGRIERRLVTALFVDVVGSTALAREVGAERLKRTLDRAFAELSALIGAEGGTVEKYAGDAIHALFGAPVAHRDDPERALRAAHACVRWTEAHAGDPVAVAVRVGVETGEAIVDLGAVDATHQQMSLGACVNVAARLQQLAEPGEIVVGPACREATDEIAEFVELGEVDLRGLGPLRASRLAALTNRRAGVQLPLVGRERELDLLGLAYRRAVSGRSVLALVSGAPGQGKTRLVGEFLARLEPTARVLRARCRPTGELGARNPLHELLTCEGVDASSPEGLTESLGGLFDDATERDRVGTAVAHSAGLAVNRELESLPTGQRQDEVVNAWRRYLGAFAREKPLVVWVDDLHWAGTELVHLLDRLSLGAEIAMLVIGTARPEFAMLGGIRPGGDRFFLTLDPLDERSARALAREAGGGEVLGIGRAEGNPLFVIELARARSLGSSADVPLTLQGVIGARLDELPPADRELLQRAAIVGETFTAGDVALLSGREPAEVAVALERLAELLYVLPVARGLRFHHALVRDVAYGRVATAERLRLHARFALDGVNPEDAEVLAYHLWAAVGVPDADWVWEGSDHLSDLRVRAREAHLAAARRYANRFAYGWAVETCRHAFRFASDPLEVARVEQTLGDVHAATGDADEAWAHALRARDLYREAGADPPPDFYPSFLELPVYTAGMFRERPGDALVDVLAHEGEAVARRAGDRPSLARLIALHAYRFHDLAAMEEALRLSEDAAEPEQIGSFLGHAAIFQVRVGEFAVARRIYRRLDAVTTPSGLVTERPLEFRAILELSTGHLPEAERLAGSLVSESASRGPHLRTHAYRERSHVLLARGDWSGLQMLGLQAEHLVAEHPETSFCYAVTTTRAFSVVAHAMQGQGALADAGLAVAEAPLQAEPLERESALLLAHAAAGNRSGVDALIRDVYRRGERVLWFFHRVEAVALAMTEQWQEIDRVLPSLERSATKGSPYLDALVHAIREEIDAARGTGPPAEHRRLRELGYLGWSQLLSHRPGRR